MTDSETLHSIGERLMKDEPYFAKHNIVCLQAFIRDKGKCRYCKCDLFDSYDFTSHTDHLLPKSQYPQRKWDLDNLVASCGECNHIKSDWNPADEEVVTLTTDLRERLIERAAVYIRERKKKTDYRQMFPRAKACFQKAVDEYHGALKVAS